MQNTFSPMNILIIETDKIDKYPCDPPKIKVEIKIGTSEKSSLKKLKKGNTKFLLNTQKTNDNADKEALIETFLALEMLRTIFFFYI